MLHVLIFMCYNGEKGAWKMMNERQKKKLKQLKSCKRAVNRTTHQIERALERGELCCSFHLVYLDERLLKQKVRYQALLEQLNPTE